MRPEETLVHKTFSIKVGARKPVIRGILRGSKGLVPLKDCIVKFRWRLIGDVIWIEGTAVIVDAARSKVEYRWKDTETNVAGDYEGVWWVTYPDGTAMAVPTHGYIPVVMEA